MSSEWVKTEIVNAREREVRKRRRSWVPHTFVGFECVGDHGPIGGNLAETGRTTILSHSFQRQE